MTDHAQLLAELARRGVRLEARGDRLRYTPASAVTPELRRELRRHKPALLQLLRHAPKENGDHAHAPHHAPAGPVVTSRSPTPTVSVVVTCHDYGRFLESALLSALGQTWPVHEILVVDDASTDDTPQVARRFAPQGVRYLRVEHRNAHRARHEGFQATTGDFVLFLDADNYLLPRYVETGLHEFVDRHVGVVYADLERFGTVSSRTSFPPYSRPRLMRRNFVDASAIVRREALLVSSAFDLHVPGDDTPEDYVMFQCLAREGWDFRKQPTPLQYRTHPAQKSLRSEESRRAGGYFTEAGMAYHDVTLFVPLSGRRRAWQQQSRFLERQTWPHDRIRMILCDTSGDPEFNRAVRDWIARSDYPDVRHFQYDVAPPGLADQNRRNRPVEYAVQLVMCRIYNRLRAALETDYCWILEDDVVPPDDVLPRLLRHFAPDVATVSAPYRSRWDPDYVVWTLEPRSDHGNGRPRHNGRPPRTVRATKPPPREPQVTRIDGSGFGCLVLRAEVLQQHLFTLPAGEPHYDPYFFRMMGDHWRRLCDWSCECQHLAAQT